jgi:hypothetical protein
MPGRGGKSRAARRIPITTNWEKSTDAFQRKLEGVYDEWSAKTTRELARASLKGANAGVMDQIVANRLPELEKKLTTIMNKGTLTATKMSVGEAGLMRQSVQDMIARSAISTEEMIKNSLIPSIRDRLAKSYVKGIGENELRAAMTASRSRVGQYAGGYWVATFEAKRQVGLEDDKKRIAANMEPEKIRWVLDPNADHCEDSGEYHGCTSLEGEYNGWSELPTVPAGKVTCRGNCRCALEVFQNGEWTRGGIMEFDFSERKMTKTKFTRRIGR